jgi:hypothetical protein
MMSERRRYLYSIFQVYSSTAATRATRTTNAETWIPDAELDPPSPLPLPTRTRLRMLFDEHANLHCLFHWKQKKKC